MTKMSPEPTRVNTSINQLIVNFKNFYFAYFEWNLPLDPWSHYTLNGLTLLPIDQIMFYCYALIIACSNIYLYRFLQKQSKNNRAKNKNDVIRECFLQNLLLWKLYSFKESLHTSHMQWKQKDFDLKFTFANSIL